MGYDRQIKENETVAANLEKRLQVVLNRLASSEQEEVLTFAEFLAWRRREQVVPTECLSEEEHARIVAALDEVATLSQETGLPVSNRDHDTVRSESSTGTVRTV